MRLAYADPPYPGKADRYAENTEVDHVALITQLSEYDGWALSTDEPNLQYVLGLCPPKVRVLAWGRSNSPPYPPSPYKAWEPVIVVPARKIASEPVLSYLITGAPTGRAQRDGLTGQKTPAFCEWVIRSLAAERDDTLDDIFPGTGVMGETWTRWRSQTSLLKYVPTSERSYKARANLNRRVSDPPRRDAGSRETTGDRVTASASCTVYQRRRGVLKGELSIPPADARRQTTSTTPSRIPVAEFVYAGGIDG